jgi:hypothetical protein
MSKLSRRFFFIGLTNIERRIQTEHLTYLLLIKKKLFGTLDQLTLVYANEELINNLIDTIKRFLLVHPLSEHFLLSRLQSVRSIYNPFISFLCLSKH